MQYDVFISCKSEDYQFAEVIYKFLEENGVYPFLASIELRKLGESEYRKAITEALKSSYHMIVFASKAKYIDSDWVYYEWDWFVTAKLKGLKQGQIVTFLRDVNIININADLWKYESFTFDNYKEKLLNYVETPAYLQRKEQKMQEYERKRQKIAEQERAEKAEKERIKKLLTQKDALTRRLALSIEKVNREMKEMVDLNEKLGTEFEGWNICPICGDDRRESNRGYCETCGWFFATPKEYVLSKESEDYEERLQLSKDNWRLMQKQINVISDAKQVKELQKEIDNLQKELKERLNQLNLANKQIVDLQKELDRSRSENKKGNSLKSSAKKNDYHEAVDLGLSVKWATCNVGAEEPEDYGEYFAWGETKPKNVYSWETYKWCNGTGDSMNKYHTHREFEAPDNRKRLVSSDDVATVKWGFRWRMPTKEEFEELINKCTWVWTRLGTHKGYRITGPSGKSIFLPFAGYKNGTNFDILGAGCYWSDTLNVDFNRYAFRLNFYNGNKGLGIDGRCNGFPVRPVCD